METINIISIILISFGIFALLEAVFIQLFKKQLIKAITYFTKYSRINRLVIIEFVIGLILLLVGIILN